MKLTMAALAVLAVSACVSTAPTNGVVTIPGGNGGIVGSFAQTLDRYQRTGHQVRITGDLFSDHAAGVLSGNWSHVCVDPDVRLHLHAAHIGGWYHAPATQQVHDAISHPQVRAEYNAWLHERAVRTETMHHAVQEWLTYPATTLARMGAINIC